MKFIYFFLEREGILVGFPRNNSRGNILFDISIAFTKQGKEKKANWKKIYVHCYGSIHFYLIFFWCWEIFIILFRTLNVAQRNNVSLFSVFVVVYLFLICQFVCLFVSFLGIFFIFILSFYSGSVQFYLAEQMNEISLGEGGTYKLEWGVIVME